MEFCTAVIVDVDLKTNYTSMNEQLLITLVKGIL